MSNKPRINHSHHAGAYPHKLAVYQHGDGKRWLVDRGWTNLEQFETFQEALNFVREELTSAGVS